MKKLILFLLISIPLFTYAQPKVKEKGRAPTQNVIIMQGSGDSDGYISNVTLSNDTLFFTGVLNAFNNYIRGIANLTTDNVFTGNLQANRFYTNSVSGMYMLNDSLMFTDTYGTYSLNRLSQLASAGSGDGYISNVSGSGNSIIFTGVGNAFNGSLTNIPKLDVPNDFTRAASWVDSNFGAVVEITNTYYPGNVLDLQIGEGGSGYTLRVDNDWLFKTNGSTFAYNLSSGTKANAVYIDPTTKELFEGTAGGGSYSWSAYAGTTTKAIASGDVVKFIPDATNSSIQTDITESTGIKNVFFKLTNDATTPGNNKYYGTNSSGTKGYFDQLWTDNTTFLQPSAGAGNRDIYANNFVLASDARLKKDIKKIRDLSIYDQIEFVQFRMKENDTYKRYGVIAQDVEKINPDLVRIDSEGHYSVAYTDLLIAKVARQDELIKELQTNKTYISNEKFIYIWIILVTVFVVFWAIRTRHRNV